jgi:hypothetical protein
MKTLMIPNQDVTTYFNVKLHKYQFSSSQFADRQDNTHICSVHLRQRQNACR